MASSRDSESLQTLEEIKKFSRSTVFTEEKFPGGTGSRQSLRNASLGRGGVARGFCHESGCKSYKHHRFTAL